MLRWLCSLIVLASVAACTPVAEPADGRTELPPVDDAFLVAADQLLPGGVVGVAYEAPLEVSGGTAPYAWSVGAEQELPGGLVLWPEGVIRGTPSEAGEHRFGVTVVDAEGRTKSLVVTLTVRLDPQTVSCGGSIGGTFSGSAMDFGGPDFDALDNLAWIGVEVPSDDTQRVELVFTVQSPASVYVQLPAEPLGSWNLEDEYRQYFLSPPVSQRVVRIDPGTNPSLSGYQSQPIIPALLVAQGPGEWSLDVVCTDGPVFERLPQYPTELGTEIAIDYDVYGSPAGVRIYTEDPLPDWMQWDETTGRVSGIAEEPGAWEITVVAETEDGRRREGRSIIGVYEVRPAQCGDRLPIELEENYFEGEFGSYWDPRGYAVHRLELDGVPVSAIDLRADAGDGHYLGITEPEPGWLKFFASGEQVASSGGPAQLRIDPRTYPASRHYVQDGELYVISAPTQTLTTYQLSIDCDLGPRTDLAALPVVEPFIPVDYPLPVIGGAPPFVFSAIGLPEGLSVRNGKLQGTTSELGVFDVLLDVEDATGAASAESYPLYATPEDACFDATPIQCGESVSGTFTATYFADGNGPSSSEVFCYLDRDGRSLGWEVYSDDGELRVDVGDPGATVATMWNQSRYTYAAYVESGSSEGVALNPWSWPRLTDYDQAAVRLAVRAYNPGDWTVTLSCE